MRPGSSPLTRGKRPTVDGDLDLVRLIPAHAGKTHPTRPAPALPAAHPRSRGENTWAIESEADHSGSSPLTRGKQVRRLSHERATGLIPAHAGKTSTSSTRHPYPKAHPRSRGENLARVSHVTRSVGSSPLTRGKRSEPSRSHGHTRLIPAHAGKTPCTRCQVWRSTAHPRSRGENGALPADGMELDGSSPLTRGKQRAPSSLQVRERLIPAHAGKT